MMQQPETEPPTEGLNPQEIRYLKQMSVKGFNLTPEMIKNISSEITLGNLTKLQSDMWSSLEINVRDSLGNIMNAIAIDNPMINVLDWKPGNLDFMKLWGGENMKLSVNMLKGFLSIATQNQSRFIHEELSRYDVEDLAAIVVAQYLYGREREKKAGMPWRKGKIPKMMRFPKKFRIKMQQHYSQLVAIRKNKRIREKEEESAKRIYG